jgi:DnaJ family protein A protein 5
MIPGLQILCLGLGKPFSDRSAQIQLALLLELSARLQSVISVQAYDPVSDDGDRKVLDQLGVSTMEENLVRVGIQGRSIRLTYQMGRHRLDADASYLLYMPHCSRTLYESILHTNFEPSLGKKPLRLLLGNDLADYIGFVRTESSSEPKEEEFTKAKKKRKGKLEVASPKDGILERLGT